MWPWSKIKSLERALELNMRDSQRIANRHKNQIRATAAAFAQLAQSMGYNVGVHVVDLDDEERFWLIVDLPNGQVSWSFNNERPHGFLDYKGALKVGEETETSLTLREFVSNRRSRFRWVGKRDFINLMNERGAELGDIGQALGTIEDAFLLSDGKKPVYMIELAPECTQEMMADIRVALVNSNLMAILLPSGVGELSGALEL